MPALQVIALETTTPQLRAPASGDTYSAPRALDITPETLTGSSATSSLSIAQTWNTTGTPTALSVAVTDTASNASSLLANFTRGGNSVVSVTKTALNVGDASAFYNTGQLNLRCGSGDGYISVNGSAVIKMGTGTSAVSNAVGWGLSASVTAGPDVFLYRDAANTLAQRNGVNAQAFRVYNSFTDASNGEWLGIRWSSNDMLIGVQANGTGSTNRQMHFSASSFRFFVGSGASARSWDIISDGSLSYEGTGSGHITMREQTAPAAPAANGVRIYAEDNGAGKTRLMALFATGVAQQLAVEP